MGRYAGLADANDEGLSITEQDLAAADSVIDTVLRTADIDPADVTLPHPLLAQAAVYYASWQVAIRSIAGESSPLEAKARLYRDLYRETVAQITRQSLGLGPRATARYGSIQIGRG